MNDFGTFTKIAKNVGDLGKFIAAKGFKKVPKVQKITNSGHTDGYMGSKTVRNASFRRSRA